MKISGLFLLSANLLFSSGSHVGANERAGLQAIVAEPATVIFTNGVIYQHPRADSCNPSGPDLIDDA